MNGLATGADDLGRPRGRSTAMATALAAAAGLGGLLALGPPAAAPVLADPAGAVARWTWWTAVAALGYLATIAVLATLAAAVPTPGRRGRRSGLAALVHRLCLPALRSVLLPIGLAGGRLLAITPAAAVTPPAPVVMVVVDEAAAAEPTPVVMTAEVHPALVPQLVPDRWDSTPPAPPPPSPPAPGAAPSVTPAPTTPTMHTVRAGEHCWSIAQDVVHQRLGRSPSIAEVASYWRTLLAANQDRFVTGDPDLILPGQDLVVP